MGVMRLRSLSLMVVLACVVLQAHGAEEDYSGTYKARSSYCEDRPKEKVCKLPDVLMLKRLGIRGDIRYAFYLETNWARGSCNIFGIVAPVPPQGSTGHAVLLPAEEWQTEGCELLIRVTADKIEAVDNGVKIVDGSRVRTCVCSNSDLTTPAVFQRPRK
jgi:hypothetical protein